MSQLASTLISEFPHLGLSLRGNDAHFTAISPYEETSPGSMIFIDDLDKVVELTAKASVIVTTAEVADAIVEEFNGAIITTNNVRLAQALIRQRYNDYQHLDHEWHQESNIHPTANVHPSATLCKGVSVGPNSSIGANCVIGEHTVIRSNSVIEHDSKIGSNCVIHNLVNIGYNTHIGKNIGIESGTIIGSQGYGYASDETGQHHRIPHTGSVHIHDDVNIGANCAIDRGTFGATIIGRGTKIDNQCHIAHNVSIGKDCLITAQCVIAGSSRVGDRVIMSGQTGVIDHMDIADDVVLVHRAGVTEHIKQAGMWAGIPAKPFKEYVANLNLSKKLKRLEEKFKKRS
jgi:UDP-3-O-[3-hydroxymyristoyl] glucosamine N-acyltransferase